MIQTNSRGTVWLSLVAAACLGGCGSDSSPSADAAIDPTGDGGAVVVADAADDDDDDGAPPDDVDAAVPQGCGASVTRNVVVDDDDTAGDLAQLAGVQHLDGNIRVSSRELTSLAGLECLESANAIFITSTQALVDLDGLSGLRTVGNVTVQGNAALTSVSGLAGITVGSYFQIDQNRVLPQCRVEELRDQLIANGIAEDAFFIPGNGPGVCN